MGKVRSGNHVFVSWKGDHGHHVHVFRDNKLVVKWDLDNWRAMEGRASGRVLGLIRRLKNEGRL